MRPDPLCLLYSQDIALHQRVAGLLAQRAEVRALTNPADLERALQQFGPAVLLMDSCGSDFCKLLAQLLHELPHNLIIVLGPRRSDPVLDAVQFGVYAVEELDPDRLRFQTLISHAHQHLALMQENALLKAAQCRVNASGQTENGNVVDASAPLPLQHFSRALRNFDNINALINNIVEGIADIARVSRVGLFAMVRNGGIYRLRAGLRCMEASNSLEYAEHHPLVQWLELHAHLLSRFGLDRIVDSTERLLLQRTLDSLGAEVIVPLFARGRVLGWFFVGHRATGVPFEYADLEKLTILGEHIAGTLENALLYEAIALQKTLAETLLHAMDLGIVAAGEDGIIRWYNRSAEKLLDLPAAEAMGCSMEKLGSRLANLFSRTLRQEKLPPVAPWCHGSNKRLIGVEMRPLLDNNTCVGALALLHDVSAERQLVEREEQVKRSAFWNDLAASMSHEIRNPLTAIKTFAQLLPDRYGDNEFRSEFSTMVNREVEHLNSLIDQINAFAHPPAISRTTLHIRSAMQKAIELASTRYPASGTTVEMQADNALPSINGDLCALADAFSHILINALESLAGRPGGHVTITAHLVSNVDGKATIQVVIMDSGPGIPPAIRGNVFSPFCTTKARGMGLGLPIAQRTIIDHNGQINIESGERGTRVIMELPVDDGLSDDCQKP
ncbi:MAG: ATP-binding protein [bacterium]